MLPGNVDLTREENVLPASQIDLGYATRDVLKKVGNTQVLHCMATCYTWLLGFVSKLMRQFPLNFKLNKAISCVDPAMPCGK